MWNNSIKIILESYFDLTIFFGELRKKMYPTCGIRVCFFDKGNFIISIFHKDTKCYDLIKIIVGKLFNCCLGYENFDLNLG